MNENSYIDRFNYLQEMATVGLVKIAFIAV
jgi:hypothetical protein